MVNGKALLSGMGDKGLTLRRSSKGETGPGAGWSVLAFDSPAIGITIRRWLSKFVPLGEQIIVVSFTHDNFLVF